MDGERIGTVVVQGAAAVAHGTGEAGQVQAGSGVRSLKGQHTDPGVVGVFEFLERSGKTVEHLRRKGAELVCTVHVDAKHAIRKRRAYCAGVGSHL